MTIDLYQILLLCLAAFCAGFVDAVVGGGGLIQTPAALVILSAHPVAAAIASIKIPSFSGTSVAAIQYIKKVSIRWKLVTAGCTVAFFSAYAGSYLLTRVSNSFMQPVLLVVLAGVAVYTFLKKDFGQHEAKDHPFNKELWLTCIICLVIGFYDGFIGPGAGSFLILAFVSVLGLDFLHASAKAKLVNMATNLGSITLFLFKGHIIWMAAIPMAICNAAGGALGARMAIARGNRFIRIFFLFVVVATLLRFTYDIFVKS
ncbi:MAG TPA: TSUP family transporter [Flavisolibacter sp.]